MSSFLGSVLGCKVFLQAVKDREGSEGEEIMAGSEQDGI